MTQEIEISDCVQNLVLHELVTVAQTILIQDTEFVENNGVFQTTAQCQAIFAQIFDLLHETEVRAREISRTYDWLAKSISAVCADLSMAG